MLTKNILNYKKLKSWLLGFGFFAITIIVFGLINNPEKIALPNPHLVQTIEMEQFNEGSSLGSVIIHNEESIMAVMSALKDSRNTTKFSINDYPVQSNYLIVKFNQEDERRILYLYSENGSYHIEEPYVGIFKSNRSKSVGIYKVYTENSIQQVERTDGLNDAWIQNPSKDPVEVVQSAIENQANKDYTISVKFGAAKVDDTETQRQIEIYKDSELAGKRGWTKAYLAEHFLIVKASYYVEYDHTKTFMDDGNHEQYFYLTRDTDTGLWVIIDNSSAST